MALSDWEIILGEGLMLSDKYKASGKKSLSQDLGKGSVHMVHTATYNDAPKNVEIRTWMTHDDNIYSGAYYIIGVIARKQSGADTYFYGVLDIGVDTSDGIAEVTFDAGYYINGSQTSKVNSDITDTFRDVVGDTWVYGKWIFVRMLAYEISGQFNIVFESTPVIDTPDVSNPPLDQLTGLTSATIDIPTELQNGGACGIIVGNVKFDSSTDNCYPYYDYTQIFY